MYCAATCVVPLSMKAQIEAFTAEPQTFQTRKLGEGRVAFLQHLVSLQEGNALPATIREISKATGLSKNTIRSAVLDLQRNGFLLMRDSATKKGSNGQPFKEILFTDSGFRCVQSLLEE